VICSNLYAFFRALQGSKGRLLAYIIDGKNRMIAVKDREGKIVARTLFRLLWDESEGKPVLYQDRIYPHQSPYAEKLQEFAKKRALELGIPLYDSNGPSTPGHRIVSLGSRAPYEYEDGAGGVTNGQFTIHKPHLVSLA
jgi:hypothetical protein